MMPMWNFGYVVYGVGRDNVPVKVLNMMNMRVHLVQYDIETRNESHRNELIGLT